jgi:hypothetical protein
LDRWNALQDEFFSLINDPDIEDEMNDKPIRELARLIIEKRGNNSNTTGRDEHNDANHVEDEGDDEAKIAARTVEALGLPSVGCL